MTGWGSLFTQKAGTIMEVTSPVFKGTTAMKMTQTYQTSDGLNYHSEAIKRMAQLAGQDLYYGQAVYLPTDWTFHDQNVTFQQWAPENPEAPWVQMFLQGEKIRFGGRGAHGDKDVVGVGELRGTWLRIVTRIHMATDGLIEVWLNGKKVFSDSANYRAMGPSLRWSNGIYCTRWDTETPKGPRVLSFVHDNLRIATTLEEADPDSWSDGDAPPPPPPDAGAADTAAPEVDSGAPAGATTPPPPQEPPPAPGGTSPPGGAPAGGTGGQAHPAQASGCQVGGDGSRSPWLAA